MGSLLVAAAIDLGDGSWCGGADDALRGRIANSLGLGQGGPVGSARVDCGLLFTRAALRDAPPPRLGARRPPWTPHRGADGAYVLFAGELHDRDAILADLPERPAGQGDDAIYAAALAQFGDDCDRRLSGRYAAIAFYPDERRLRLVRSALAAPPLHLWRDSGRIVAASTPRAAIAAGASDRVDRAQMADALYLNFGDSRRGWFRDIERVATGEVLHLDRSGLSRRRFWDIFSLPEVRFAKDADYVEAVETAMAHGSRETLRGFGKVATELSGGLDSQAVASFALDALPPDRPLKAYCWVPQEGFDALDWPNAHGNEAASAEAFAAMHPRIDLELVDTGSAPLSDEEDKLFLLAGLAPMGAGNLHWGHEILRRASRTGCDVVLDGDFGNSGFSYDGLTGPASWLRQGRPGLAWREVSARGGKGSDFRRFISQAVMPQLPLTLRARLRRARGRALDPFESWCPLRPDFAERSGVLARGRAMGHDPLFLDRGDAREWRAAVIAGSSGDGADLALALELLHGVPKRSPLAYRPLFELAAGIPDEQYLRNGQTRWLARRVLKGRVPEEVRCETRLGIQSSDWPLRWSKERDAIMAELDRLEDDADIAEMLDLPRLKNWMREWSGGNSVGGLEAARIFCAVGRGLTAARFVKFQERGNA